MKRATFIKGATYDEYLPKLVNTIKNHIYSNSDDYFLFIFGLRGCGKSNLMMHMYELYDDNAKIHYLALKENDFAKALFKVKLKKLPRFVGNDEANISKRESLSKYNKKVLSLYYSIRGKQIFHIWANPSINIIDKQVINDLVNGAIYIKKVGNHIRPYYFFKKTQLIDMYEKNKNLNIHTIDRNKKKYALYRGLFKKYDGKLNKAYLDKKENRMDAKIDEFYEEYGDNTRFVIRPAKLVRMLNVGQSTAYAISKKYSQNGTLEKDEDYIINIKGNVIFSNEGVVKLIEAYKDDLEKGVKLKY